MDRISHATAVDIGGGRRGFRSKDTVAGLAGTVVTATHMNASQEELMAMIEEAALVPDPLDLTQVAQAVRSHALNWMVAGGTADAIVVGPDLPITAYTPGLPLFIITGAAANTGAMTIDGGAGAVALKRRGGAAMESGDVPGLSFLMLVFDGAGFRSVGLVASDILALLNASGKPPQLNHFEMKTANTQAAPSALNTIVNDFILQTSKPSDAVFSAGGLVTIGPKTAGVWVFAQAYVPSQVGGAPTTVQAYLYKNGVPDQNQTVTGTFCTNSGSVRVAEGDVLAMAVWQNSGGARTHQHAPALPQTTKFNLYQISS